MSDNSPKWTSVVSEFAKKVPKLTRKQFLGLAVGGMVCGTAGYAWHIYNNRTPDPVPSHQIGNITTSGDGATVVPVLATDHAHVEITLDSPNPIEAAKEALPDPDEFAHLEQRPTDNLDHRFQSLIGNMDHIITSNHASPKDSYPEMFCDASREAFYILAIVFVREHPTANAMSNQLNDRYERAHILLTRCGCKLCSKNAASVARRKRYVAAVVRHGPTYVSASHVLALAAEP